MTGTPDLTTRRGTLRSVGGSAAARLMVLPVSAVLGIVVTRVVIENYGTDAYAQYALLVGLAALLPFADLGISAAIVNAVAGAEDPRTDRHLHRTMVSSLRLLAGCSATVVTVVLLVYAAGLWPVLLGDGLTQESGSVAATVCMVLFGFNILVAYGQRILAALGLNAVVVLLGGLQTPVVLVSLLIMIHVGLDGGYVAVAAYVGTTLTCLVCIGLAARRTDPMLRGAYRSLPHVRTEKGARVFDVALPMLVQTIALPIAMQSDRLVLSHLSSLDQLATYSLAAQMFTPILSVVTAAGFALWPVFAKARAAGVDGPVSPYRLSLVFTGVAAVAVALMALASGFLARLASGGEIRVGVLLVVAFAVLVVVQSAKYPFGVYLTDAAGLRFQAWWVVVMIPVNLGLSLLLTPSLGAVGPLIGSIVGVVLCQLVPNVWLVRRRRATGVRR